MNLINTDLDLIWIIHPECGFCGVMIHFWISPKKRKIRFWIQKSGFGFPPPPPPQKNAPLIVRFLGKSKSGFLNPKTDHESIKSTLRVDSSVFGKGFEKSIFDKRFSVQKWYTTVTIRDVLTDYPVRVILNIFVISRIIKVEVRVISQSRRLRLITLTDTLIILDITKTESNNCFIIHWTKKEMSRQ